MPKNLIGILLSLLALCCGLATGVLVKQVSNDVPLVTILLGRFWFSLPVLFLVTYWVRRADWMRVQDKKT